MLSRACLAEHPLAKTERAKASNSGVNGALLRSLQRSCDTMRALG
jgi:hypothetical protein